ncbi:hypothetical protein [Magnetospirillum fulvum]|uniref:Structural protein P5 n=1 Tax=Magnetospirillum fulvum MGU-K5 TaxID=1316936 RepID=S9SH76_MAGFU|nr:hypothetical protein [Magnetospirillum fulvum]EPY03478.1 hypothetical protein K678_00165 [Magnetospirillum fulvum MGU-K5]
MSTIPRGIRNNNPGNIDYGPGTKGFVGCLGVEQGVSSPRFCRFDSMAHGIRAVGKLLGTYRRKYGLDTVRGLITRWAPPNENDTGAYVAAVARAAEVGPDDPLPAPLPALVMTALVRAIIRHENGAQAAALISDADINRGVALALDLDTNRRIA